MSDTILGFDAEEHTYNSCNDDELFNIDYCARCTMLDRERTKEKLLDLKADYDLQCQCRDAYRQERDELKAVVAKLESFREKYPVGYCGHHGAVVIADEEIGCPMCNLERFNRQWME